MNPRQMHRYILSQRPPIPRFVKLVGGPLNGFYVKQEQDLRTIVIGAVEGWGECTYKVILPLRPKSLSMGDDGEWVGGVC